MLFENYGARPIEIAKVSVNITTNMWYLGPSARQGIEKIPHGYGLAYGFGGRKEWSFLHGLFVKGKFISG